MMECRRCRRCGIEFKEGDSGYGITDGIFCPGFESDAPAFSMDKYTPWFLLCGDCFVDLTAFVGRSAC
jgi:hypothetical protein